MFLKDYNPEAYILYQRLNSSIWRAGANTTHNMTNQLQHQQRRTVDVRIPAIEKYAYCLCLHVKPTTIFIAVFKLTRALLLASILLNNEFTVNEQVNDYNALSGLDERHKSTAIAINILTRIIMASVSAVGIYAVISGRAALLMPLYAILLIDFFFALPSFYNKDLDPSLADGIIDMRNYSASSNTYTRYSIMLVSTISMIVKIYFLCVIWKCYRYLRLIELVSPLRLSEIYPHIHQNGPQYPIVRVLGSADSADLVNSHVNMAPPPYDSIASTMKPPNYEEAMKSSSIISVPNPIVLSQQQQQIAAISEQSESNQPPQQTQVELANNEVRTTTNLGDGCSDYSSSSSATTVAEAPVVDSNNSDTSYNVVTNSNQNNCNTNVETASGDETGETFVIKTQNSNNL